MKEGSSIDRIDDLANETERVARLDARVKQAFDRQDGRDEAIPEREKNDLDWLILHLADEYLNRLRQDLGLSEFHVPEGNVHIVPEEKWSEKNSGGFTPFYQEVTVKDNPSALVRAEHIFHELVHFHSYAALEVTRGEKGLRAQDSRLGLAMYSRPDHQMHFNVLNEALTAELSRRFMLEQVLPHQEFGADVEMMVYIKQQHPDVQDAHGQPLMQDDVYEATVEHTSEGRTFVTTKQVAYRPERQAMWHFLEQLGSRSGIDAQALYHQLVRGMLQGDLLGFAKTVERSFGRGSFRKIGEAKTADEFIAAIDAVSAGG